ncbi:hypothetical protein AUTU_19090 [Aureibacter tunicatorum]|nr:hypothetical protein AUTU_19090 [Aureibacter tunicatorum]
MVTAKTPHEATYTFYTSLRYRGLIFLFNSEFHKDIDKRVKQYVERNLNVQLELNLDPSLKIENQTI